MENTDDPPDKKVEKGMSEGRREETAQHLNGYENPWTSPGSATPDLNTGQRFSVEQVAGAMEEEKAKSPSESSRFSPRKISTDVLEGAHEGSIGYATNEAIPMTVFYRNEDSQSRGKKHRPTLEQLQNCFQDDSEQQADEVGQLENGRYRSSESVTVRGDAKVKLAPKFGWLKGVMLRCLLNIWGVMLFLRLTWVVGQSGMIWSTVIIMLSAVVTTMTTLSMSAVCTNGEVKGGGAYFLISRSLGPEFGGSIGLIFSLANAVAVALYVVGFAETVRDILRDNDALMIDEINDIRIIGIISVFLLLGVSLIGLEWVVRTQMFLLVILLISIVDACVGTFLGPQNALSVAKGFVGLNMTTFTTNLFPDYRGSENFFSVFAVFFPAATGILAGVNISGDLKNAQTSIPKGTFWAILISTVVYILLAWFAGACVLRDANGVISVVVNATLNATAALPPPVCPGPDCRYGLINDFQVMEKMSAWGPLVTCGIFAATLSSALASLVGAPKTFQALCKDRIFPGMDYFGVGVGPGEEPRRGYILTFVIAVGFIAVGKLNVIAPVISNFFLMSYALINYAVFAASLGRSPGWRPSFRYYNMWVSLVGAVLCVAIMFLINWWAALVTIFIIASLHKYVDIKKPEVNWGSSAQAFSYIRALRFTYRLNSTEDHVKNFRPQCLVLTGPPSSRPNLTYIVSQITKNVGLMVCGQVNVAGKLNYATAYENEWLKERKIRAFHTICTAPTLRAGAQSLLQTAGLGKLKPNTLVIGFKRNWMRAPRAEVEEYVHIINDAFELKYGVAILRVRDEFEIEEDVEDGDDWMDDDADVDELFPKSQTGSVQAGSGSKESQSVRLASPDSGASEGPRSRGIRLFHIERSETPESTSLLAEVSSYARENDEDSVSESVIETVNVDDESTSTPQNECDSEAPAGSGLRQRGVSSVSGSTFPTIDMDYPSGSTKVEIGSLATVGARERSLTPMSEPETSEISGSQSFTTGSDRTKGLRVSLRDVPEDQQTEQSKPSPKQSSSVPSITFKGKQKGTVDVWWLFDDGGLTILIPHLLTLHRSWKGCKLRILLPASSSIKNNEISMANLLKKFRIDVSSIELVHGMDKRPSSKSIKDFKSLPLGEELEEGVHLDKRILRQIRIGELLRQHSKDARLIVMTLPVPKLAFITPLMYMGWLEVLSADLPPVFLLRGNQTSVLTFYC